MKNQESSIKQCIENAVSERFGEDIAVGETPSSEALARIVGHRSHRRFTQQAVDSGLLRVLFACAMSAPSKSDLQQADIVHIADRAKVKAIATLIPDMPWINDAPLFLVFCGNNRRIRQIGLMRGIPFANDHLDHFMNAAVDAGLVLMNFVHAAEAVGLGCCPISAVRNHPGRVSELLSLPDHVFPLAGLAVGYPASSGQISPRLPMAVTVHTDRYDETLFSEKIDSYDHRRHSLQPYRKQRHVERFGNAAFYGWSEDKARQYGVPERADFGTFIRGKGFNLS
jgi:nitroreductase/FMN reductase [NAD(P)H]